MNEVINISKLLEYSLLEKKEMTIYTVSSCHNNVLIFN